MTNSLPDHNAEESPTPRISALDTPVQFVKGVGPKRQELLGRLGIATVEDLLFTFPRDYMDRSRVTPIAQVELNKESTILGEIIRVKSHKTRTGKEIVEAIVQDNTGALIASWFNPYVKEVLHSGQTVLMTGKATFYRRMQLQSPHYEIVDDDSGVADEIDPILPVYPLTEGLNQGQFRKIMRLALANYLAMARDPMPEAIAKQRGLLPLREAVQMMHFPKTMEDAQAAKRTLVFHEFLILQLGIAIHVRLQRSAEPGIVFKITPEIHRRIRSLFPFKLTPSQEHVVAEIVRDMESPRPMNRLLQGDVGSGKTVVALYAMLIAIACKKQAALMAPTEILAEQHFLVISHFLENTRVRPLCLTGGLAAKERESARARIAAGDVDITIGTHALIERDVQFADLGLVVVDEQHRFGVMQRASLRAKSDAVPDTLIMTATPIPRTLALTVFGDLDISVIEEKPPGRQPIKTYHVPERKRKAAYQFIRDHLRQGERAFFVYPLVEESEKLALQAATEQAAFLQKEVFPDFAVGLLHGRMKPQEKDAMMESFRCGKIQALVATTVVEVGVDIPEATIMVIEHADRFGLAQLHQLRGRIGRGGRESYCLLFGVPATDEARERLAVMARTNDGFEIAEEDLRLRGPGEFFGTRQHGLPDLRIGDLLRDQRIMQDARKIAFSLIDQDPRLEKPDHRMLRDALLRRFQGRLSLIGIA